MLCLAPASLNDLIDRRRAAHERQHNEAGDGPAHGWRLSDAENLAAELTGQGCENQEAERPGGADQQQRFGAGILKCRGARHNRSERERRGEDAAQRQGDGRAFFDFPFYVLQSSRLEKSLQTRLSASAGHPVQQETAGGGTCRRGQSVDPEPIAPAAAERNDQHIVGERREQERIDDPQRERTQRAHADQDVKGLLKKRVHAF